MVQTIILLLVTHSIVAGLVWYLLRIKGVNAPQHRDEVEGIDNAPSDIISNPQSDIAIELNQEIDRLNNQLKLKNIELTKQVKDNEDKTRILSLLREKLNEAEFNPKINKHYWSEMDRLLSIHLESNQSAFEMQIDELHQDFIKKLHSKFPDLSLYDLRLCAYLKIGMNSKEIADLLRVLPSSINVSRSRLRKKLGLQPSEDLFGFLTDLFYHSS